MPFCYFFWQAFAVCISCSFTTFRFSITAAELLWDLPPSISCFSFLWNIVYTDIWGLYKYSADRKHTCLVAFSGTHWLLNKFQCISSPGVPCLCTTFISSTITHLYPLLLINWPMWSSKQASCFCLRQVF